MAEGSNTDYVLSIEELTVSFDGFKAVDNVTMYVDKNELRVVIGPNGAGKTTLLDLICGKTSASSGFIKFNNHELTKMSEHQIVHAGVGRKFQTPSIYENLSVYENLEVSYPQARNVLSAIFFKTTDDIDKEIRRIAKEIFLDEHLNMEASLLSHGQKQWLEIGMLLIQDPELLMGGGGGGGGGRSVIVIEHDMDFVEKIASKVTVLHQGKLLAEGQMSEVKANPEVIEVYLGH